eukprot:CAMPEP_0183294386 /NCGR_PEP_ID=MMETSP0160_2-20130417/2748_1 /TAXON_ID=2839 ORGANISM="Odontella Sinensis, Strain Grunow 1884" /NCGR_SAMPLE_ID=MMETSP0160_2 /ASSEMBLY_ACC=CAM_ASM_000250 /LENGTH=336 /DNA_ID=CAMNT_0025455705 /DNA_START=123 /DNA_END=1130 /DNA_ORIENTATION=+
MNAKKRTIGVDKKGLDCQVQEKKELRLAAERERSNEDIYQNQLCQYLEERELILREARTREQIDVRETILEQKKMPKNNAIAKGEPLDLEACGLSSVQSLAGEDAGHSQRKRAQQIQIQQWCAQQISEKCLQQEMDAKEQDIYNQYVVAEDEMRAEMDCAEAHRQAELTKSIEIENLELARQAQLKAKECAALNKKLNEIEVNQSQRSHFLSEDTNFAKSASSPHRYRPDHFKGFSKDQIQAIYNENDRVIEEKGKNLALKRQEEEEWSLYQGSVVQKLEEIEIERQKFICEQNRLQAAEIEQQRKELKAKQARMQKERFGSIGEGFFQGFGTSCR